MADMSGSTKAKSDQINYVDLGHEGLQEIRVTSAHQVDDGKGGLKTVINYEGDNGRPYKPSKGMDRLIQCKFGWGNDSDNWIGKSILLVGNKDVVWAGSAHGGIQIKALSHIDKAGFVELVALNGKKRSLYKVDFFEPSVIKPTADELAWIDAIKSGCATLEQIENEDYRNKIQKLIN
jgi:hypothetical protein